jgi:hypothetical protein
MTIVLKRRPKSALRDDAIPSDRMGAAGVAKLLADSKTKVGRRKLSILMKSARSSWFCPFQIQFMVTELGASMSNHE